MKLIFIGPQGSGKGTQAKRIAKKFGLCHISSGDLLRDCDGDLRLEVDGFMGRGELVPDDLIIRILKERLKGEDCEVGFILDGFPRNTSQAEELKKIVDIDKVVEISISDDEAVKRVCGRRNCKNCGAIYNVNSFPMPKVEGICDECGGELFLREDDNEEALRERLKVYHEETEGVVKMYTDSRHKNLQVGGLVKINGEQGIERVFEDILEALE